MKKTYTSDLTALQWQAIEKLISVQRKSVHSLKLIVEAIFYLTKNGITWRDLPQGFPPWQTVYFYFRKWSHNDTAPAARLDADFQRVDYVCTYHDRQRPPAYGGHYRCPKRQEHRHGHSADWL